MGTKLVYPLLPDEYRWNLLNKISYKIGKWPGTSSNSTQTKITFEEDLTPQEIADVDAIMADPDTAQDPIIFQSTGNTYVIKDTWEYRAELIANIGFEVAITYRSSGIFGPKVNDQIIVQPTDPTYQAIRILTNPQKNALVNAVADLGAWE